MADDYDISVTEHLHRNRIVYLSGEITTDVASSVVQRLFVLDAIDPEADIRLYISSPGGSVYAGLAIYDAMQLVRAPVSTLALGPAFSMAAWLVAAGERGRRFAAPNARFMLHQGSSGLSGTTSDLRVAADNVLAMERRMTEILAAHSGLPEADVRRAIERDLWLSPEDARTLGLIDGVSVPAERKRPTDPDMPAANGSRDTTGVRGVGEILAGRAR